MSTHNMYMYHKMFFGELEKIILELSLNTHSLQVLLYHQVIKLITKLSNGSPSYQMDHQVIRSWTCVQITG